jgi:hypothetical protein
MLDEAREWLLSEREVVVGIEFRIAPNRHASSPITRAKAVNLAP